MHSLDYHAKEAPKDLYAQDRIGVLFFLILSSNVRNRCWPSYDRIHERTGIRRAKIVAAVQWLRIHRAIELVPVSKRVGKELELPIRQHVYQLTGVIEWQGSTVPYFHVSPDDVESSDVGTIKSTTDAESSAYEPKVLSESSIESFDPKRVNTSKYSISAASAPNIDKFPTSDDVKNAFAIVCYGNKNAWELNAAVMGKALKQLTKYEKRSLTLDDLRDFRQWWKQHDWRGRQQQLPEPYTVASVWARFRAGEDVTEELDKPATPNRKPIVIIKKGESNGV